MSIRIQPLPDGRSSLFHGIQSRRIGGLLQQLVGHVVVAIVRKCLANPGRPDESRHQRISRISLSVVTHIFPSNRLSETSCKLFPKLRRDKTEGQRKHVRSLYVYRFPFFRSVGPGRNRPGRHLIHIRMQEEILPFLIQIRIPPCLTFLAQ